MSWHKIETCGVLAAVYKGRQMEKALSHSYYREASTSLCGIGAYHLADDYSQKKPTCKRCLRKDPRFNQWRTIKNSKK
jgi:hypothetical protein